MKRVFICALTLLLAVSMPFMSGCGKDNASVDNASVGENTTTSATASSGVVTSTTETAESTVGTTAVSKPTTTTVGSVSPTSQSAVLTKPTKTGSTTATSKDPLSSFVVEFEGWLENLNEYKISAPSITTVADETIMAYTFTGAKNMSDYCVHIHGGKDKSVHAVYVSVESVEYDFMFSVLSYYVYASLGLTAMDADAFLAQFDAFPHTISLQKKQEGNYCMTCTAPDEFLTFIVSRKGSSPTADTAKEQMQAAQCSGCYADKNRAMNYLTLTENAVALGFDVAIMDRALVSSGNRARIANVMHRALKGEEITIGYIGGSVTEGAYASDYEKTSYAGLSYAWWVKTFPKAKFRFVNAGYGGTSSLYGVHRVEADLLKNEPDFVVVEFGVNDCTHALQKEAYANLVHRILSYQSQPAVMLLFVMGDGGDNRQMDQEPVGFHYDLPMISYRDAIWPEVANGRVKWTDIGADYVHPTNLGHAMIAELIISYLTKTYADLDTIETKVPSVPKPYMPYVYENAVYLNRNNLTPLSMSGFRQVSNAKTSWMGNAQSKISFAFTGKRCYLIVPTEHKDNLDVTIRIDDGPSFKLEPCVFYGGAFANYLVFDDDDVMKHTIEITCNSGSLYISGLFVS